ncbi:hypothetical protein EIP91_009042 [Steccherinum ochraceum]|uniref:Uncharacterized protein n=1 Tax=Steccherinum ochraceum TaxID=92696 RepID=A0A4R0R244_9APHY|nr:hypothetical protein EIP91_009042 [Steccherinum ochraceum]
MSSAADNFDWSSYSGQFYDPRQAQQPPEGDLAVQSYSAVPGESLQLVHPTLLSRDGRGDFGLPSQHSDFHYPTPPLSSYSPGGSDLSSFHPSPALDDRGAFAPPGDDCYSTPLSFALGGQAASYPIQQVQVPPAPSYSAQHNHLPVPNHALLNHRYPSPSLTQTDPRSCRDLRDGRHQYDRLGEAVEAAHPFQRVDPVPSFPSTSLQWQQDVPRQRPLPPPQPVFSAPINVDSRMIQPSFERNVSAGWAPHIRLDDGLGHGGSAAFLTGPFDNLTNPLLTPSGSLGVLAGNHHPTQNTAHHLAPTAAPQSHQRFTAQSPGAVARSSGAGVHRHQPSRRVAQTGPQRSVQDRRYARSRAIVAGQSTSADVPGLFNAAPRPAGQKSQLKAVVLPIDPLHATPSWAAGFSNLPYPHDDHFPDVGDDTALTRWCSLCEKYVRLCDGDAHVRGHFPLDSGEAICPRQCKNRRLYKHLEHHWLTAHFRKGD